MSAVATQRSAWWLLAGMTLLNVLNFGDRFLLVSFANSIIRDLELTKFQFTLLTGLVFSVFYTLFGLFAGSLADRHNRPRLIAAGLALWSGLTAATGAAVGFMSAAAARIFIGVGEAVLTPAALSMLSDRLPPERRSLAAGVYYLGIPVGIGSSFIFAGVMGPLLGWRGTFVVLGVIGLLAALVMLVVRDPPRGGAEPLSAEVQPIGSFRESAKGLAHALRTSPLLVLTLIGCACTTFVQGGTVLDIVWWVQERGYTEVQAQQITGTLFLFGGITGALFGGFGADWAYRNMRGGRLLFLAISYALVAPILLGYRLMEPATPLFYFAAFVGSASMMLFYGAAFATVQEIVAVNLRGAAVGLLILFNTLVGHATGGALTGFLADRFTTTGWEQPLTWALLLSGLPGLLAIPSFWWASRLYRKSGFGPFK